MLKPITDDTHMEAVLEELDNDIYFNERLSDEMKLILQRQNLCIRYLMKRLHNHPHAVESLGF